MLKGKFFFWGEDESFTRVNCKIQDAEKKPD